jgi:hypothetical protein
LKTFAASAGASEQNVFYKGVSTRRICDIYGTRVCIFLSEKQQLLPRKRFTLLMVVVFRWAIIVIITLRDTTITSAMVTS